MVPHPVWAQRSNLGKSCKCPGSGVGRNGLGVLLALAHHAGSPGESFTWFAFVFRWMAGVFFRVGFCAAGLWDCRGLAHHVYDILVGWIAWRL